MEGRREERQVHGHDIIVIGCSAGGLEALLRLVRNLPSDLPAALFVVQHFPANSTSFLPDILSRAGPLPAAHPEDGETIVQGRIYVAPPDHHLLINPGHILLRHGPKESSHRPAIDPLFRTAAKAYGRRVVGVLLSGMLDDGSAGLLDIKTHGGVTVVQDPEDALYPQMPRNAIESVDVDHILPVSTMGRLLIQLALEPVAEQREMLMNKEPKPDSAEFGDAALKTHELPDPPSSLTCPDCGGALWERDQGRFINFRCHVGHAYSTESLLSEQSEMLERALWASLRILEERRALMDQLTSRARTRNHSLSAEQFEENAQEAEQHAQTIRQVLTRPRDYPREGPTERQQGMDRLGGSGRQEA